MTLRLAKPTDKPPEQFNRRRGDDGCIWCAAIVTIAMYECIRGLIVLMWTQFT